MRIIDAFQIYKNTIALEDNFRKITYQEFDNITNFIASQLNFKEKELIGLEFNKSIDYILTLFAVLKTGNPFVVLNTELPLERLHYIESVVDLKNKINQEKLDDILRNYQSNVSYDYNVNKNYDLNDLAYVIFTSGSTGNPKGVKVTHRGIYNIIQQQIQEFNLEVNSKNLLLNSISFDASLSDIFSTLLSGATLCIENMNKNIIESMRYFQITHIDISPSILNILYKESVFQSLKTIIVGGELVSENAIEYLGSHVKIINAYGPTEATICTSMKVLKTKNDLNCIGKPIDNVEYLIDNDELIICSSACADGYWNLESDKFYIQDNKIYYKTGDFVTYNNGEYYFLGRKDRQVKIKGFRVELEEIEQIIKRDSGLDTIAVTYKNNQLVCFSLQDIDKSILTNLPYYMMPNYFITLPNFQLNSNGKIDYHVLERISMERDSKTILDIFKEVLEKEVNEDDDWNSLGGDSLSLIHLMVALEEQNFDIKVEDLLKGIKIKDLFHNSKHTMKLSKEYLDNSVTPIKYDNYVMNQNYNEEVVFITGVTGYLGIHLLEMLLKADNQEKYICLVRGNDIDDAYKKIESLFHKYQLDSSLLNTKPIEIVLGDISKDKFGLSSLEYQNLKNKITKVIHSAALVNNLLPYEQMYETNVNGTLEIIKLQKPIHYISTLSVFVGSDKNKGVVYEDGDLSDINYFYGGYAQSKYVAEELVKKSNLPYVIYRLGLLTGHTEKKYQNTKEFFNMLLKALLKIKTLPDVNLDDFSLDVSPINFISDIINGIYHQTKYNEIYHIANTKGASLQLIYDTFIQNGIEIQKISPLEFKRLIFHTKLDANIKSLLLTLCRFDEELYHKYRFCDLLQKTDIEFDMTNTKRIISHLNYPNVDKSLMDHYLNSVKDDNHEKTN